MVKKRKLGRGVAVVGAGMSKFGMFKEKDSKDLFIEDLGFFKPGQGYKAVADGLTRLDGSKPINTSGGLKCKGHPVGATGVSQLFEVWTQLRGKAGRRQVPINDLRIGAAHNLGGTGGTCTFTILERR